MLIINWNTNLNMM